MKERINATYGYLAGSLAFTGASAVMFSRSARGMAFLSARPYVVSCHGVELVFGILFCFQSLGLFLVGAIGSSMVCRPLPYTPELLLPKLASFGTMCGVAGISLAPLTLLGGPLVVK